MKMMKVMVHAAIDEGGGSSHTDDIASRSFSDLNTKDIFLVCGQL